MTAAAGQPAAPPPAGSLRWHAWLFTPEPARTAIAALFALEAELRAVVRARVDHGVTHLKLQWWKDELQRLQQGAPRHPMVQALAHALPEAAAAVKPLQEFVASLEFEFACATCEDETELDAYLALADGLCRAVAFTLGRAHEQRLEPLARAAGQAIRGIEIIRDLRQDAMDGRIHLPLSWLAEHQLSHVELRAEDAGDGARRCLQRLADRSRRQVATALSGLDEAAAADLRGLRVLVGLHAALLDRIERERFRVGGHRIALGPAASLWTAWRIARQH
jgi:phytoene synthase